MPETLAQTAMMKLSGWDALTVCRECGGPLAGAKHGWITVHTGRKAARVHTTCRAMFTKRPTAEQLERSL